jgi:hypothetical protein
MAILYEFDPARCAIGLIKNLKPAEKLKCIAEIASKIVKIRFIHTDLRTEARLTTERRFEKYPK